MFEESLTDKGPPDVTDPARNANGQKEGPECIIVVKSCLRIVGSDNIVRDLEDWSFGFSG